MNKEHEFIGKQTIHEVMEELLTKLIETWIVCHDNSNESVVSKDD
ncbi:hypothetical protein [Niallia taxi]|nr:hypothetical protein [Niallia taxi]